MLFSWPLNLIFENKDSKIIHSYDTHMYMYTCKHAYICLEICICACLLYVRIYKYYAIVFQMRIAIVLVGFLANTVSAQVRCVNPPLEDCTITADEPDREYQVCSLFTLSNRNVD